jgi:hypothetical protein
MHIRLHFLPVPAASDVLLGVTNTVRRKQEEKTENKKKKEKRGNPFFLMKN